MANITRRELLKTTGAAAVAITACGSASTLFFGTGTARAATHRRGPGQDEDDRLAIRARSARRRPLFTGWCPQEHTAQATASRQGGETRHDPRSVHL
jgi:hypothetical protein